MTPPSAPPGGRSSPKSHPDRARARGLPAEFIEVAEAKAAAINAAFDEIMRERRAMTLDGAA
jgi:DnaJ like chaperone protein